MMGNVDIIGFGMDFCEMDLWWLMCCKKRKGRPRSKVNWYELNPSEEKRVLAEVYGINVISDTGVYKHFYNKIADDNQSVSKKYC